MHVVIWILTTAAVLGPSTLASGRCKFPKTWKGRWYQSGLGEIMISSSFISQKGMCVEHGRDLYVIEDQEASCFRCLLLMKHHRNIIQYKETFCLAGDSLKNICSQIRVEAPLYTLVREPATPIQCPFQEAYTFSYSDGLFYQCPEKASALKPCVGGTRVQADFRHCAEFAQFNNQDMQLECLGTWKEGSDFYMYGKFTNDVDMPDSYRCFKYEHYGPDLFVSMSADGTCRGLRSAKDGPLVITAEKDPYGWLQASCAFPAWLEVIPSWQTVSADALYQLDLGSKSLLIQHRSRHGQLTPLSVLRCVHVTATMATLSQLVSFSTHDCSSSYQCVTLKKLHDNAIYVHLGDTHDVNDDNICSANIDDLAYSSISDGGELLVPVDASPASCPLSGTYYKVQHGSLSCEYSLSVGCGRTSLLHLNGSCSDHNVAVTVQCLASWTSGNTSYVIVQHGTERACIAAQLHGRHESVHFSSCGGPVSGIGGVPGLEGTFHTAGACNPGAEIPEMEVHQLTTTNVEESTSSPVIPLPGQGPTDSNPSHSKPGDHSVTVETSDESSSSETKEQQYYHVNKDKDGDKHQQSGQQQGGDNVQDNANPSAGSAAAGLVAGTLARSPCVALLTVMIFLLARR